MKKFWVLVIIVSIIISGCDFVKKDRPGFVSKAPGVEYWKWPYRIAELQGEIEVFRIMPEFFEIKLQSSEKARRISEWEMNDGIIMNGGYFDKDLSPAGFLVIEQKIVSIRKFDQDKSGLLEIKNGIMKIRDLRSDPWQTDEPNPDFALQSYPFLIKGSKPALQSDSGLKSRRTAIGMDARGRIYFFISNAYYLSLFEMMQQIRAMSLHLEAVLNLDGGTSTGIKVNLSQYQYLVDSLVAVPQVIKFSRKK